VAIVVVLKHENAPTAVRGRVVDGRTEFESSMKGLPIRYPQNNIDFDPPFFTKLTPHDGGGCFTINAVRVDAPTTQNKWGQIKNGVRH
jgi:hypothetical protein